MSILQYRAEYELARIYLLLRRSLEDVKLAEDGNPITNIDLSSAEFELCNGKPHKDISSTYSRRRQLQYALRSIQNWHIGAMNGSAEGDVDVDGAQPPKSQDWKKFGRVMQDFNLKKQKFTEDNEDLHNIDDQAPDAKHAPAAANEVSDSELSEELDVVFSEEAKAA